MVGKLSVRIELIQSIPRLLDAALPLPCFSLYVAPEVLKVEKERDSIASNPIPETAFKV